jgi:putative endonuclease
MRTTTSAGWFCYLLVCADGTLYTGITNALDRRLIAHNAGAASKYTRTRRPVRLLWWEAYRDRAAASRREAAVKALPRALKLALAEGPPGHAVAAASSRARSALGRPAGSKR